MRLAFAMLVLLVAAPVAGAPCSSTSGPFTTALVELYTSEGCSSCPPAEQWLSSLNAPRYGPDRVVPIALHVDYWDYLGWKDPYAKREFARRQHRLSLLQPVHLVYTPQVLLQGRDFRGWGTSAFAHEIEVIARQPARARLTLEVLSHQDGMLDVRLTADLFDERALREGPGAYLAAYQNRLQSEVQAGENRGRTLLHDYVVLEWLGPLPLGRGRTVVQRTLPLLPGAGPGDSGVAAFVQNRHSGDILQALMLPACR